MTEKIDNRTIWKYDELINNWLKDPCYDLSNIVNPNSLPDEICLTEFAKFVEEYALYGLPIGAILLFHKLLTEKVNKEA